MKKRLLYVLFAMSILSGCSQGTQAPSSEPVSAPVSIPASKSDSTSTGGSEYIVRPVRPDPAQPFAEKQVYPDEYEKIDFDESQALEIGVGIYLGGDTLMKQLGNDLFVFNDSIGSAKPPYDDVSVDQEDYGIFKINVASMKTTGYFHLSERCKVLFTESGFLTLCSDRIERYDTSFELVETIEIPENSLYPRDVFRRPCVVGDENHILFVPSDLTLDAYLLDLATGEEQLWQVKATVDGQEIIYDEVRASSWHNTNDPDVLMMGYGMAFVNWKTHEMLDFVDEGQPAGVAASYSHKIKYLTGWPGGEGFTVATIARDGVAVRYVNDVNIAVDLVNETQMVFEDYSYSLIAVYRTDDEETFYLLNKSITGNNTKGDDPVYEVYLYRLPK